jgi:protein gp37
MADTDIEWADKVWNPIAAYHRETGKRGWFCVHQSEGCRFCYAERINKRLGNGLDYTAQNLEKVRFEIAPNIAAPMRWRKPSRIFVDSMFDPFLDGISFDFMDPIFAVMANAPHHTFLLLTKNPKRMREYITSPGRLDEIDEASHGWLARGINPSNWPLPNVWLGVSTERQKEARERIPELLATPAHIRFISYEPALGPLNLVNVPVSDSTTVTRNYLTGEFYNCAFATPQGQTGTMTVSANSRISWVIAGGESGPGARPAHPSWFRSMKWQCHRSGAKYFFKQWGAFAPGSKHKRNDFVVLNDGRYAETTMDFDRATQHRWNEFQSEMMHRADKKDNGALLDEQEYRQFPEAQTAEEAVA